MTTTGLPPPDVRRRMAAAGQIDDRSIKKAYLLPAACRAATLARVADAARRVGYPPPPRAGGAL